MKDALYRKYRSRSLDEVVGQEHITDILKQSIKAGKTSHAYLFTGPRGVGKTSVARILAHEINHLPYGFEDQHLDIIEIDAASNNGVDDVRSLREKVQIAPVSAEKKVYIIDEVHMLSKPAFNALLKTLEEPPLHVVFILATTDVDKLPATIISRTQRFGFKAIAPTDALGHLKNIAKKEKINITDDALELIIEHGDGSFRDSISLLDQLSGLSLDGNKIKKENVESVLGLAPTEVIEQILNYVDNHDVIGLAKQLQQLQSEGMNAIVITKQLTDYILAELAKNPNRLKLLDALLDVAKSPQPEIKLLSVLGSIAFENKPPKTVGLDTPKYEISASLEELTNQATKKRPKLPSSSTLTSQIDATIESGKIHSAINWSDLLKYTKENYIAIGSVLNKCDYQYEDGVLTIYALNKFYKKKLDDPKYSVRLAQSIEAVCGFTPEVHTLPTSAPLKSSAAAHIADIMGGGIEVATEAL